MYLNKNLSLLRNFNPDLAEKLEELKINENMVEVVPSFLDGYYTCRASKDENEYRLLLHSIVNPIQESVEQVNALEGLDKAYFACIFGFGFGYHVRELLKQKLDRGCILVIEPRLDILKAAFSCMDFSDILSGNKVYIMDMEGNFKEHLYGVLMNWLYFFKNLRYYNLPVYELIYEGGMHPIREIFRDTIEYLFFTIGNSAADTLQGIGNTFNNLSYILNSFDITSLKHKYSRIPAVVVSAGPSLDKNFRLLKDIKGKAIIIAAETIMHKLLKNGIVPDIVSVLERGVYVYETFFKDKEIDPKIVLCGQSLINDEVFRDYPGKKITCLKKDTQFESWLSDAVGGMNTFHPGQSVANMNYALARELGCDPIILIGQDLSYAMNGSTHAGETVYEGRNIENDKITYEVEPIRVKGNYTDYVLTHKFWYNFLRWFEMEIPNTNALVINATEGGAYIEGTELMTLQEAIDKYCTNMDNVVDIFNDIKSISEEEKTQRLNSFICAIRLEIEKLINTKKMILKGLNACNTVMGDKFNSLGEVSEYFNIINSCRIDLQETSVIFNFIVQAQKAVQFLKDADFISLRNIDEFKAWTRVQNEYFNDLNKVLDLTTKMFKFGLLKARIINGENVKESFDLKDLLKEIGE